MAISPTTDWSKIRYVMLYIFALFTLLASNVDADITSHKHKRQLFREQLLPEHGGKIPSSAFWPERLRLNKLNSLGLYSEDGVYLEHREPDRVHVPHKYLPNTLKVAASFGSGRDRPDVSTTYLASEPRPGLLNVGAPPGPAFPGLPVHLPYHSLHLVNQYRQRGHGHGLTHDRGLIYDHGQGQPRIFSGGGEAGGRSSSCCATTVISDEFAPYLKKLHDFSD